MMMCLTKGKAAINQARVQEFVRGGGQNLKSLFLLFNFSEWGAAQKMAEKMIFSTKKVAKYR